MTATSNDRPPEALPDELEPTNLKRRALQVIALLVVLGLVAALAPGLGEVRDELANVNPAWIALAIAFEFLSCASYVLMFRPVFCRSMSWKLSWQISWSEVGVGSLVPASGAGGLALGAWILRQAGMPARRIAQRSVAFFLIKSSVNFVFVALLGYAMAVGLFGADLSLWLTAFPATLATLLIGLVVLIPRIGRGPDPSTYPDSKWKRAIAHARGALVDGVREAIAIIRSRNVMAIAGSLGYFLWDVAVLWTAYRAFGETIPWEILLMGYLIGQLGGLLPLPGGVGGIEGGLIGTLIVYGAPAAATATAVLIYRLILFWVPLIGGAIAFSRLRKTLDQVDAQKLCSAAQYDSAPVVELPSTTGGGA